MVGVPGRVTLASGRITNTSVGLLLLSTEQCDLACQRGSLARGKALGGQVERRAR